MKNLKPPSQVHDLAPESFRDMIGRLFAIRWCWEFSCYFLLTKGVILKLLNRLSAINRRDKHIVKAELPREHVHQDVHSTAIMLIGLSNRLVLGREAIQNV